MVVSNIFYFHPYLGKWSNLTNTFQRGWNHKLVMRLRSGRIAGFVWGVLINHLQDQWGANSYWKLTPWMEYTPPPTRIGKDFFSNHRFSGNMCFFRVQPFLPRIPCCQRGNRWIAAGVKLIIVPYLVRVTKICNSALWKSWGKGSQKWLLILSKKTPMVFYDLLCFLEINHQTKVCKS